MSRLASIDAGLHSEIAALSADRQARLAFQVARSTAGVVGIESLPAIKASLDAATANEVALPAVQQMLELVDHRDDVAWQFEEQGDETSYLAAFSQARAANAVLFLVQRVDDDWPLDVCYESYAATGSLDVVRAELASSI